jgi:homoserine dehydrogenase
MHSKRIALVGFGKVGNALVDLLSEIDPDGKRYIFSGVASRTLGVVDFKGASSKSVASKMRTMKREKRFVKKGDFDSGISSWLKEDDYDVLVEATPSNYIDAEPALTYLLTALGHGKDAVTCNKAPVAMYYDALLAVAAKSGTRLRFESTVMDGTPIFSTFMRAMPQVRVRKLRGILNSTCNIVIDCLYSGMNLQDAIAKAKKLGATEDDPGKDLSGFDSAAKIVILGNALTDTRIQMSDVRLEGLDGKSFSEAKGKIARNDISTVRQVSTADFERRIFRVSLESVRPEDVLFGCRGSSSMVVFSTDLFGNLAISETDPTLRDTAFGLYSDIVGLDSAERK